MSGFDAVTYGFLALTWAALLFNIKDRKYARFNARMDSLVYLGIWSEQRTRECVMRGMGKCCLKCEAREEAVDELRRINRELRDVRA